MNKLISLAITGLLLSGCAASPEQHNPAVSVHSAVGTVASEPPDAGAERVADPQLLAKPEALKTRYRGVLSLLRSKQYDAARVEVDQIVKEMPNEWHAVFLQAQTAMYQGQRAEGEALFARVYALQAEDPAAEPGEVLLILGRLCREREDIAAARSWLDKVSPLDASSFFFAQVQRSILLSMEGDAGSALAMIATLEPATPEQHWDVVTAKGRYLWQAGKIDEAYAFLSEGTPRVPPHEELFNLFASVANASGHFDQAESAARSAIRTAPGDYVAYNNLAYWLAVRNVRVDDALTLITKALELAPDSATVAGTMGWVQYRAGNLGEAETFLRRSYTRVPDDDIAVNLAEVLWKKGDHAGARELLGKVQRSSPSNTTLRETLGRLNLTL